jgi:hypothetical protein
VKVYLFLGGDVPSDNWVEFWDFIFIVEGAMEDCLVEVLVNGVEGVLDFDLLVLLAVG